MKMMARIEEKIDFYMMLKYGLWKGMEILFELFLIKNLKEDF
jgi:hypothetical protein